MRLLFSFFLRGIAMPRSMKVEVKAGASISCCFYFKFVVVFSENCFKYMHKIYLNCN